MPPPCAPSAPPHEARLTRASSRALCAASASLRAASALLLAESLCLYVQLFWSPMGTTRKGWCGNGTEVRCSRCAGPNEVRKTNCDANIQACEGWQLHGYVP